MEDVLSNNSYFCRFKPCWPWSVSTLWLCRSWSFAHWRGFCRSPDSTALLPAVSRPVQTPAAAPAGAVFRSVGCVVPRSWFIFPFCQTLAVLVVSIPKLFSFSLTQFDWLQLRPPLSQTFWFLKCYWSPNPSFVTRPGPDQSVFQHFNFHSSDPWENCARPEIAVPRGAARGEQSTHHQ